MSTLVFLLLAGAPLASAATCYDYYYNPYDCSGGLGYGARIGIGIGIAAAVLVLVLAISYWRRKKLRRQFAKYRPPALPTTTEPSSNPYASNPPPPPGSFYARHGSSFGATAPQPPPQTYQPSTAGNYTGMTMGKPAHPTVTGEGEPHGYEYLQAREQERLEREQANSEAPPPGYDVANSSIGGYAPPPGPPPMNKRTHSGAV